MKSAPTAVKMLLCATLAAALATAAARAAWLDGFGYRRQFEVDCSKIDTPLTNYPALVRLTTNNFDFAKARPDGFDVRFATADGQTLLAFERERHDAVAEAAEYWVNLPLVTADSNTVFYMYYGSPSAADGADAANVWDEHFVGVWHQNDFTSVSVADSTVNANHSTKRAVGEPTEADGKIGKAQQYDGVNDYIWAPDVGLPAQLTLEAWIKTISTTTWQCIMERGSPSQIGWHFYINTGHRLYTNLGSDLLYTPDNSISYDTWHHVVAVWDGTTVEIYIDGQSEAGKPMVSLLTPGDRLYIGIRSGSQYPLMGMNDEVRVSNRARSPAWIKAGFHAGNGDLLLYGDEESRPTGYFKSEFF